MQYFSSFLFNHGAILVTTSCPSLAKNRETEFFGVPLKVDPTGEKTTILVLFYEYASHGEI
jgi:hypothetical protein